MKFCYNTNFTFLNNLKDLDPSYKTDLDLWDCFGRKKLCLITEEIRYAPDRYIQSILCLDMDWCYLHMFVTALVPGQCFGKRFSVSLQWFTVKSRSVL